MLLRGGCLGLAGGLTHIAGACLEALALLLLVTWPPLVGQWADAGGGQGPRGGAALMLLATWLPGVGRWADAGGRHGPRGGQFECRWRRGRLLLARGLTQVAGVGCEMSGPFGPFWAVLGG